MYALAPVQDLLRLGKEARMNTPGTTDANWQWRMTVDQMDDGRIGEQLLDLNGRYGRAAGSQVS